MAPRRRAHVVLGVTAASGHSDEIRALKTLNPALKHPISPLSPRAI